MLVEADLPDDPAVLRAMLLAADIRLAERDQRIVDLECADTDARHEIERLNAIIDAFQRHRFGARSEQFDPDQFDLAFEEISAALSRVQAGLDAKKLGAPKTRNTNRGRPAHLERVEQIVDIDSKACACCGGALHVIGEDVAERLDPSVRTRSPLATSSWFPMLASIHVFKITRLSHPRAESASTRVAPLVISSGHCLGTLCVFDPTPRDGLTVEQAVVLTGLRALLLI